MLTLNSVVATDHAIANPIENGRQEFDIADVDMAGAYEWFLRRFAMHDPDPHEKHGLTLSHRLDVIDSEIRKELEVYRYD